MKLSQTLFNSETSPKVSGLTLCPLSQKQSTSDHNASSAASLPRISSAVTNDLHPSNSMVFELGCLPSDMASSFTLKFKVRYHITSNLNHRTIIHVSTRPQLSRSRTGSPYAFQSIPKHPRRTRPHQTNVLNVPWVLQTPSNNIPQPGVLTTSLATII